MKVALMAIWKENTCCGRIEVLIGQEFVPTCCGTSIGFKDDVGFIGVKEIMCTCCGSFPQPRDEYNIAFWRILDRAVTKREWGNLATHGCLNHFFDMPWKMLMDFKGVNDICEFLNFAQDCGVFVEKELAIPSNNFWTYVKHEIECELPTLGVNGVLASMKNGVAMQNAASLTTS